MGAGLGYGTIGDGAAWGASVHGLLPGGARGGADALAPGAAPQPDAIRAVAVRFEATFLAEMLRHAGFAEPRKAGGGGAGEARFAPMMAEAVATQIAETRSIGIADAVAARLSAMAVGEAGADAALAARPAGGPGDGESLRQPPAAPGRDGWRDAGRDGWRDAGRDGWRDAGRDAGFAGPGGGRR
ncbi:MAG: hypothetical protein AAFV86_04140 [Pseudomonadota bacterium]